MSLNEDISDNQISCKWESNSICRKGRCSAGKTHLIRNSNNILKFKLILQKTSRNPFSDISNQVIERFRPNQKSEKAVEKVTHENGYVKVNQKQQTVQLTEKRVEQVLEVFFHHFVFAWFSFEEHYEFNIETYLLVKRRKS